MVRSPGLAVSIDSLKSRLKVLKEFEGGKAWRHRQDVQRLSDEEISVAVPIATSNQEDAAKSAKELAEFQDMIVSEKAVEDYLENQCSRYMGWIRKNLATQSAKIHGVIVARQIENKLKVARDAHDTKVHLIEFEMKISATAV